MIADHMSRLRDRIVAARARVRKAASKAGAWIFRRWTFARFHSSKLGGAILAANPLLATLVLSGYLLAISLLWVGIVRCWRDIFAY